MASRPLKIPGHRPLSRPEDRDRPFAGGGGGGGGGGSVPRRSSDPRLGQLARCLSRGRRPGTAVAPVRVITDAVAAREAALRRLRRVSEAHAEARQVFTEVRRELVDALLHVRLLSLEVVEAIESWRGSCRGSGMWRDQATGENYLLKMKDDTRWLAESPLGEILNFSPKSDPFFVIPSTHDCASAPTNQMTPTLQARRHSQAGKEKKAVLPLQGSLLRRIRKAELLILRECVQARMQQGTSRSEVTEAATPSPVRARDGAGGISPEKPPAPAQDDVSKVQAHLLTASLGVLEEVMDQSREAAPAKLAGTATLRPSSAGTEVEPVPNRPRPPAPEVPSTPFVLRPVEATSATIQRVFEEYIPRAEQRLVVAMEPWKGLEDALSDEGPDALQWFWLFKAASTGFGPGDLPDGLAVFRLKRMSTSFGQLLHISVVDLAMLEDALHSVKAWMFTLLPIRSIRVTLWYAMRDGELALDKDLEGYFKRSRFRWFQLMNSSGKRGSVMNGPRFAPPDMEDGPDPVMPPELPSIEFCLGQAWFRGAKAPPSGTKRVAACGRSIVLAAACLRYFTCRDAGEAAREADARTAPARELAREGIVRGLLSGTLESLLAKLEPASLKQDDGQLGKAAGVDASASLAARLTRSLESSGTALPAVLCEGSEDAEDLVRRGSSAPGYADAVSGLGVEDLPEAVAALKAQDAAFGRLFICLDWYAVTVVDSETFEVPVHASGNSPGHPHPVFYVATSEDNTFVVIIPWEGGGLLPPSESSAFAACTEVLRTTEPVETSSFGALRLSSFDVRRAVQTSEIASAGALGMPAETSLHVSEFSSLSVSSGRGMPGRLPRPDAGKAVFAVKRPFAVTLWHTDIDELNVPLAVTMVV